MQDNYRAVVRTQPAPACQPHSIKPVVQIAEYIVDHLDVDLSASALAAKFCLRESVLLSCFQTHTAITLDQFVLRRRLERALSLLKTSKASDSAIAARIGFGTPTAFQAAFFHYLGVSPSEYRNSLEQKWQVVSRDTRKRPASLPACHGKNSVVGRLPHSQFSN